LSYALSNEFLDFFLGKRSLSLRLVNFDAEGFYFSFLKNRVYFAFKFQAYGLLLLFLAELFLHLAFKVHSRLVRAVLLRFHDFALEKVVDLLAVQVKQVTVVDGLAPSGGELSFDFKFISFLEF
jgi:hypothetical protein